MSNFSGRWITSYGPMELQQTETGISGTYSYQGIAGQLEGNLQGSRFVFQYRDATGSGFGWFELTGANQFNGQYRLEGTQHWVPWLGQRETEWDGIWNTSFGRMRLVQEERHVYGIYDGGVPARIDGTFDGTRFTFRYFEPTVQGEGWFELAPDGRNFHGAWRPDGGPTWGQWSGQRVVAQPGLTWLVVIEAHWQRSLGDAEYSYGEMLKTFFARVPTVAVRHRFFNDGASLERWCRELVYVPEPAIVLISSHGTQEGVAVQGHTIDPKRVVDCLRPASNIVLLHFATCLVMKEDNGGDFARKIGAPAPFPISGYTTSIDWGGSAVLEFSYFDLILSKHFSPEHAAEVMQTLVTYAGDNGPELSPYGSAGFRFLKPA